MTSNIIIIITVKSLKNSPSASNKVHFKNTCKKESTQKVAENANFIFFLLLCLQSKKICFVCYSTFLEKKLWKVLYVCMCVCTCMRCTLCVCYVQRIIFTVKNNFFILTHFSHQTFSFLSPPFPSLTHILGGMTFLEATFLLKNCVRFGYTVEDGYTASCGELSYSRDIRKPNHEIWQWDSLLWNILSRLILFSIERIVSVIIKSESCLIVGYNNKEWKFFCVHNMCVCVFPFL